MSKVGKQLENMRNNPRDWRIDDLKSIAKRMGVEYRQPGSSHVTFRTVTGNKVTVPAHKPIKPIYVKLFLEMIDELIGENDESV